MSIPEYMNTQMMCLEYVSYTRAKQRLFFVTDCKIVKEYNKSSSSKKKN
jgi:ATP-dependent exoDNAse (exonuclease V) beta subunit